jgi:hypothetical protein
MTAIEYYEEIMKVFDRWLEKKEISWDQYYNEKNKLIKQAKEMEKEQIVRAIDNVYFDKDGNEMTGEQYYKETFKSE